MKNNILKLTKTPIALKQYINKYLIPVPTKDYLYEVNNKTIGPYYVTDRKNKVYPVCLTRKKGYHDYAINYGKVRLCSSIKNNNNIGGKDLIIWG